MKTFAVNRETLSVEYSMTTIFVTICLDSLQNSQKYTNSSVLTIVYISISIWPSITSSRLKAIKNSKVDGDEESTCNN